MNTAHVVLINPEGLILGVSRKDNYKLFGLVGGKMDDLDMDNPINTAIRECKEETGLDIVVGNLVLAMHMYGNISYTYLAAYTGEINTKETHLIKWIPMIELLAGPFGDYNEVVSRSLDDMGIKFKFLYSDNIK